MLQLKPKRRTMVRVERMRLRLWMAETLLLTAMWTHVWAIKRRHSLRLLLLFGVGWGAAPLSCLASCVASGALTGELIHLWPSFGLFSTIFLAFSFLFLCSAWFFIQSYFLYTTRAEGEHMVCRDLRRRKLNYL